jgi:hypothetical protein
VRSVLGIAAAGAGGGIVRLPFGQNRSNQMKSDRKTHTHNICGVSTYKELLFIFHQNRFLLNNPVCRASF